MGKQHGVLVSGIGPSTSLESLKSLFQAYGRVRSAFRSSAPLEGGGWAAIVLLADSAVQENAIASVNGSTFEGSTLKVGYIKGIQKLCYFLMLCRLQCICLGYRVRLFAGL